MEKAFTLIELVVVLVVIGVVTHLAVVEFAHVVDGKREAAADAQLENVRDAVFRMTPGGECEGFLADMGRLPRPVELDANGAIAAWAPTNGTLAELWLKPPAAKAYALRQATTNNLCVAEEEMASLKDENIWVATGWRGPYLRLPLAKSRLFDPWGNAIEEKDSAGLVRVWATNGAIHAVSHYGAKAQASARRDVSLEVQREACKVAVYLQYAEGVSHIDECAWYGPADGMITGKVESVSGNVVVCDVATPGPKVLSLRRGGARVLARPVDVPPGGKELSIRLAE